MFARILTMPLKADISLLAEAHEKAVIPLLRTHKGFLDVIVLVASDGKTAFGISLWDSKESAEAYSRSGYREVMQTLGEVLAGPPQVQLCEVTNSTVHKVAAAIAA